VIAPPAAGARRFRTRALARGRGAIVSAGGQGASRALDAVASTARRPAESAARATRATRAHARGRRTTGARPLHDGSAGSRGPAHA
jgi:hypothetical protein